MKSFKYINQKNIAKWAALLVFFSISLPSYTQVQKRQLVDENDRGTLEDKLTKRYSFKYASGSFLIYDCRTLHFACVSAQNYNRCYQERLDARILRKNILDCVPIKIFNNLAKCLQAHDELVYQQRGDKFCLGSGKFYRKP